MNSPQVGQHWHAFLPIGPGEGGLNALNTVIVLEVTPLTVLLDFPTLESEHGAEPELRRNRFKTADVEWIELVPDP